MANRRALHFVFKIPDRKETIKFYTKILGMKVLRHEEFDEGCAAFCNGPYDGKWSKTMVGYGPEDNHFVVELTYNYGVNSYKLGNDFLGLTVASSSAIKSAVLNQFKFVDENNAKVLEAPGGYKHFLLDEDLPKNKDPMQKVALACSNLEKSIEFWSGILGMKIFNKDDSSAVLGFEDQQCKLELKKIEGAVHHEKAFGRIAFSCPTNELEQIQDKVKEAGHKILKPLVSLDTPGKATVHVIILGDPDGHEICFVGDEAFRELSQIDPDADQLLNEALEKDKSDAWYAKKGLKKAELV